MDEQNTQSNWPKNNRGGSDKSMLLIGILLGIALISTIAFFVLLFRSTGEGKINETETKGAFTFVKKDHVRGDEEAPLTIILYDDFECPYCGGFEGTNQMVMEGLKKNYPEWEPVMPNLIKDYISTGKVKLIYKHFPLTFHQKAIPAAEATECAGAQGKFWEMHDKIFQMNNTNSLSLANFKQAAIDLELNMDEYNYCMDNHLASEKIQEDMATGQSLGVQGTPAALINDQAISGAVSYSEFKEVVEEEFEKSL